MSCSAPYEKGVDAVTDRGDDFNVTRVLLGIREALVCVTDVGATLAATQSKSLRVRLQNNVLRTSTIQSNRQKIVFI